MPDLPTPLHIRDWNRLTREYTKFVFRPDAVGEYLPLLWILPHCDNTDAPCFGICSYVGDGRQGSDSQEGVSSIASVLSAVLVGENLQSGKYDYVKMCEAYYNSHNGVNLVLNNLYTYGGGSFWYDIWPQVLFDEISYECPQYHSMKSIMRVSALRWADACDAMKSADGSENFNHTAFDFNTMKPVDNGKWKEPDSAAGISWIEYSAWLRFHNPRFLNSAKRCLQFLSVQTTNPYYEILLPWGVMTAAKMNAEMGTNYPLNKMINWCFGESAIRPGWGMILQRWGGYDCYGIIGSATDRGGYAFGMDTFAQAGALTPLVRYAPQYSAAIGKWMLNLVNASRLFYTNQMPPNHNFGGEWKQDPGDVIACEGLRRSWNGMSPCATGDPLTYNWGPKTNLAVYGSAYCGMLGAIVRKTNVPAILQLNCLKTDFFHEAAFPTYLYYNPYGTIETVRISLPKRRVNLYDAVTNKWILRDASKEGAFQLKGRQACLLVLVPAGAHITRKYGKLMGNGIVIAYGQGNS